MIHEYGKRMRNRRLVWEFLWMGFFFFMEINFFFSFPVLWASIYLTEIGRKFRKADFIFVLQICHYSLKEVCDSMDEVNSVRLYRAQNCQENRTELEKVDSEILDLRESFPVLPQSFEFSLDFSHPVFV